MFLWHQAVDLLRESMLAYAQLTNGSVAAGIMAVTFLARLALFPLTVRLARLSAEHQAAMRKLQPTLDAARARYKGDPARLAEATRRIFRDHGVAPLPAGGCVGALAQAPVLLALYSAVRDCSALGGRFFWIRDLSRPDRLAALTVSILAAIAGWAGPQPDDGRRLLMIALPAIVTMATLWYMAAGISLYWGVSTTVGIVQNVVVRRQLARVAAA